MRRCLLCGRDLCETTFYDAVFSDDLLCLSCRSGWQKRKLVMDLAGLKLESSYVYNDAFSSALIRYKELGDEAIADIFMCRIRKQFSRSYKGYTLVPMPSSKEKLEARGFDHVRGMFACTGLPMTDLFEKTGESDQKRRSKTQREMVRDEIVLKAGVTAPDRILLVDDTVTTGATLQAAASLLRGRGKKIRIYTVSANRRWYKLPFAGGLDIIE